MVIAKAKDLHIEDELAVLGVYYGLHMTHPGHTLPNKSLNMLTHSREDCST